MRGSLSCCQESQSPQPIIFINFSSPKNAVVFLGVCSQQNHGLPLFPFSLGVPQSILATPSPRAHPAPRDPWHSPATERILVADKEVTLGIWGQAATATMG